MPTSGSELWWVLVVGMSTLLTLAVVFIASTVLHQNRLRKSYQQLRTLSSHLQSVREEERTRIAREIHDELGQLLTVLKMDLALLEGKVKHHENKLSAGVIGEFRDMSGMIDTIIRSVRRIATELRPEVLDELGLREAIIQELEAMRSRTDIVVGLSSNIGEIHLDRDQSTALFRIVQEALTNIARHAEATEVNVSVNVRNGELLLEIRDNGRGIAAPQTSDAGSLGILGMTERAYLLDASLSVTGENDGGTTVRVVMPLNQPKEGVRNERSNSD